MTRYKNLAQLPNTRGYRFVGLCHDGREVECRVAQKPDGSHYVASPVEYRELRGWRVR